MKLACLLLLLLAWPLSTLGQTKAPASPVRTAPTAEVEVLKAQIDTMKSYQEQFVSVITWSLGAVLTMAFGLAAFNWYSSRTSYDRDLQALRHENKALHAELRSLLQRETEQAAKHLLEQFGTKQAEIQSALTKALDSKLSEIGTNVLNLEYNFTEFEADEALKGKKYSWAIYKYCQLLEMSVRQGSDHYRVGDILDEIGKVLDKPETSLTADNVTDAVEMLRRLPTRYRTAAENLIPRITRAHK